MWRIPTWISIYLASSLSRSLSSTNRSFSTLLGQNLLPLTLTLKSSYRRTDLAVFGILTIIPLTRGEVVMCSVQRCSKPFPLLKRGMFPFCKEGWGCIVATSSVIHIPGLGPPMGHTTTPQYLTISNSCKIFSSFASISTDFVLSRSLIFYLILSDLWSQHF